MLLLLVMTRLLLLVYAVVKTVNVTCSCRLLRVFSDRSQT